MLFLLHRQKDSPGRVLVVIRVRLNVSVLYFRRLGGRLRTKRYSFLVKASRAYNAIFFIVCPEAVLRVDSSITPLRSFAGTRVSFTGHTNS